jgi:multisubunit Na+/H+ antiporter MnhF subunit
LSARRSDSATPSGRCGVERVPVRLGVQLAGTGAGAAILLIAAATGVDAALDVALTLGLLAAVAAAALVLLPEAGEDPEP